MITQNTTREILRNVDILIEGNTIVDIGKGLEGSPTIDCSQRIVLPGLINTHTHYGMQSLKGLCDDAQLDKWLENVIPQEKRQTEEDLRKAADLFCMEALRTGTTTIADFYYPQAALCGAVKKHGLRAVLLPAVQDQLEQGGHHIEEVEHLLERYKGHPRITCGIAAHSIYGCSEAQLHQVNELAKKHGCLKSIHIAETRKERFDIQKQKGCLPVEYLQGIDWLDERTLLVHAIWTTKGEVNIMRKHRCHVSHCPVSNMKLASGGVMPLPEMHSAGVNVALGTDSVVSNNNLDMFEEMKVAGLLHKHHRWDARTAPLQYLLDMATRHGAQALGLADQIGSIEIGKKADIITLDLKDPVIQPVNKVLSTIIYSGSGSQVAEVIIDGERRWDSSDNSSA